jgi:hypothetical protein
MMITEAPRAPSPTTTPQASALTTVVELTIKTNFIISETRIIAGLTDTNRVDGAYAVTPSSTTGSGRDAQFLVQIVDGVALFIQVLKSGSMYADGDYVVFDATAFGNSAIQGLVLALTMAEAGANLARTTLATTTATTTSDGLPPIQGTVIAGGKMDFNRIDGTYVIGPASTSGSGSGATFVIRIETGAATEITNVVQGVGYQNGDYLVFDASEFGPKASSNLIISILAPPIAAATPATPAVAVVSTVAAGNGKVQIVSDTKVTVVDGVFADADADGDGILTRGELDAAHSRGDKRFSLTMFMAADVNGDGSVVVAADSNGDGSVVVGDKGEIFGSPINSGNANSSAIGGDSVEVQDRRTTASYAIASLIASILLCFICCNTFSFKPNHVRPIQDTIVNITTERKEWNATSTSNLTKSGNSAIEHSVVTNHHYYPIEEKKDIDLVMGRTSTLSAKSTTSSVVAAGGNSELTLV